jgi:photosystem II stability/assembly factor-like uncharacterized protein
MPFMQTNRQTAPRAAFGCRGLAFTALAALGAAGLVAACATASSGQQAAGQVTTAAAVPATASGAGAGSPTAAGCAGSTSGRSAEPALSAIQFADARHGWAAGAGGIMATSDGGRTWSRQYSGQAALTQVDFTDGAHGWAVGAGTVLRTTDGGSAWTALPEPRLAGQCQSIGSVHFVSSEVGYAIASPVVSGTASSGTAANGTAASGSTASGGHLLRTTDGGTTWTPVPGAPAGPQAACFGTARDGYLGTSGRIWRTTNAGATWSLAFTEPAPAASTTSANASAPSADTPEIQCAGTSAAWTLFLGAGAAMMHSPYLAYATENGTSWRGVLEETMLESAIRPALHLPDGPGSYPGPFSVISAGTAAFVGYTPPANGWGAAPLDLATSDGKLTRAGDIAAINEPLAAAFISASQGWVVGENLKSRTYEIEATTDSGRTWTTQYATS